MVWILKEIGWLVIIGIALSLLTGAALFLTGAVEITHDSGHFILEDGTQLYASSIDEIVEIREKYADRIREAVLNRSFDSIFRIIALALLVATSLTFILYTAFRERGKISGWLRPTPIAVGIGLLAGVPMFFLGAVYTFALNLIGLPPPEIGDALANLAPMPVIAAIAVGLAPMGEELYFRGRLIDVLGPHFGPGGAAIASSLAFAVVHGVPVLLPIFAVFGLVLVGLRRWSDGLVAPIIAHGINNAIGLIMISTLK